jgi:hypothetical protein
MLHLLQPGRQEAHSAAGGNGRRNPAQDRDDAARSLDPSAGRKARGHGERKRSRARDWPLCQGRGRRESHEGTRRSRKNDRAPSHARSPWGSLSSQLSAIRSLLMTDSGSLGTHHSVFGDTGAATGGAAAVGAGGVAVGAGAGAAGFGRFLPNRFRRFIVSTWGTRSECSGCC